MFVSCFAKASCRLTEWKSQERLDPAHLPSKPPSTVRVCTDVP